MRAIIAVAFCQGLFILKVMRKCGFTIIELLVVIAIIGALAAIIIPSLMAAKEHSRTVLCSSNLRQLLLSFELYQQETEVFPYGFCDKGLNTTLPKPPEGFAGGGKDKQGWWWLNYLQNIVEIGLEEGGITWCPSRKSTVSGIRGNILCGNYGVNRSVCRDALGVTRCSFSGDPLRTGAIRTPSATLLISDSGYSLVSWMAAVDTGGDPYEYPPRLNSFYVPGLSLNQTRSELAGNRDAIEGRHRNGMLNLGFIDGHTDRRSAETFSAGLTNTDPDDVNLPSFWKPE